MFASVSSSFIDFAVLADWLVALLTRGAVYVPRMTEQRVHWHRLTGPDVARSASAIAAALLGIRASEPVKSFLFSPRQTVARLPDPLPEQEPTSRIVFGLKSCDLLPLKVHERVLLDGEFADPFYAARLKRTVLIAADCPEPAETCFCNLPGLKPYVREGADIVVAVVGQGLLVEPLTAAGEGLLQPAGLFRPATEAETGERDRLREVAVGKLSMLNPQPWPDDLAAAVGRRMKDEAFWRRHASSCVECFGCLMACPTCYCFLLYDRAREGGFDRTRVWDACYEAAYTRVGGGANPRGEFLKRFANRFECKYREFKADHGFYACSGCGRCVGVCMGKIDIRRVLAEVQ